MDLIDSDRESCEKMLTDYEKGSPRLVESLKSHGVSSPSIAGFIEKLECRILDNCLDLVMYKYESAIRARVDSEYIHQMYENLRKHLNDKDALFLTAARVSGLENINIVTDKPEGEDESPP